MKSSNLLLLSWHAKFLKTAVLYNAAIFFLFFVVYLLLDFKKHFTTDTPVTPKGKLYFAIMNHTAAGAGDITPKTDTARLITGAHVMLAWMQLVLVFLT